MARASVFTEAQNRELRAVLSKLAGSSSQQAIAEQLGIKQQNVGRLLRSSEAGFSYQTALALVRLAGWAGLDAFFAAKRVASSTDRRSVRRAD